jgi:predicted dehydrogenase
MKNIAFISTAHVHSHGYLEQLADRGGDNTIYRIWDDMESRGRQCAGEFSTEYTTDLDSLVSDDAVDGFIICAENTRHLPLLRKILPAGRPVMCEKPLITNREDLDADLEAICDSVVILAAAYESSQEGGRWITVGR